MLIDVAFGLFGIETEDSFEASIIISFIVGWIYYARAESSSYQATMGKRICKIYVADMNGESISFLKASLRYLSRLLSDITIIGYIIAGFTKRKQALHDIITGCHVLRSDMYSTVENDKTDEDYRTDK